MLVRDLKLSSLALKAASLSPRFTAMTMKLVAPRLRPNWVINEIATSHDLRIPVKAKLENGMTAWVLLADEVGEGIRRRGCTERETLEAITSHLSKDSIFFDLGAHIGQYTLVASALCRGVHSFEPVPETFKLLQRNVRANGLANVSANQCAVSDSCGEVTIYEGDVSTLDRSSLRAPSQTSGRSFVVPSISIDAYATKHNVIPNLIKIDVEGAEIPVLHGASSLLREKHPALIVEVDKVNQPRFGFTADGLLRELKDFGYSISPLGNESGTDRSYFNVLAAA
jgi:FkbM family methyltransferase